MKISAALWFTLAMFSHLSFHYNSSYDLCFMFFTIWSFEQWSQLFLKEKKYVLIDAPLNWLIFILFYSLQRKILSLLVFWRMKTAFFYTLYSYWLLFFSFYSLQTKNLSLLVMWRLTRATFIYIYIFYSVLSLKYYTL